jgi:hypothetical protein
MRPLALLLLALAPALTLAQDAPSLASLRDKNRVLLLFAPSDQTRDFQHQFDLLSRHAEDLRERDLILLPVVTNAHPPTDATTLRMAHPPVASEAQQLDLRHRFHVAPNQFTVILIGKDGGEKLRQHTPISIEKLNTTIDAMPMRQDEMRQQKP